MKQTDKLIAWQRTIAHMHGRRKAEEFLGFLAACGQVLSSEISFYESLPKLANIAVPFFGDWISIDLFFAGNRVKNVAEKSCRGLDEEHKQQLRLAFRPYTHPGPGGAPQVVLTEKPTCYTIELHEVPNSRDIILTELGVGSYLVIPLELPRGRIGSMAILSLKSMQNNEPRQYGPAELALGEELGRRMSLAVERSILYNEGWRLTKQVSAKTNQSNKRT